MPVSRGEAVILDQTLEELLPQGMVTASLRTGASLAAKWRASTPPDPCRRDAARTHRKSESDFQSGFCLAVANNPCPYRTLLILLLLSS